MADWNINDEWARRLPLMWRWMRNFRVSGAASLKNSEESCAIFIPGAPAQAQGVRPVKNEIWVWATGHTQDGSNFRWEYDWEEIELTADGYDGWAAKEEGRFGPGDDYGSMYNTFEDPNGPSGPMGNGVDTDNSTGTGLEIQPIPNNVPLRALIVPSAVDGGVPYLWVQVPNGFDGPCEAP